MKYLINTILAGMLLYVVFLFISNTYRTKKASIENKSNKPTVTSPSMDPQITPTGGINPTLIQNKIFVSPIGNDGYDGKTQQTALKTIQKAVDMAIPGDMIELIAGEYYQDIVTKKDGIPEKPITIRGQKNSVVKGAGNARVVEINHSFITLEGFTIDGHFLDTNEKNSYRDKLVYVTGRIPGKIVTHLKILNMNIRNAGGECVRLRYLIQNSEIARNSINVCGVGDFAFDDGGKNGEGIYIGTAPEQLGDKKNPTNETDHSDSNWIHHNIIDTQGNECVDIKEGSSFNVVEYNSCTGQKDLNSGGLDSRGNENIFRYNEIFDNMGAGIRLGGDEESDGINNQIYGNSISNNKSGGIKFQRKPQAKVCGNIMKGNEKGNSNGTFGEDFMPEKKC